MSVSSMSRMSRRFPRLVRALALGAALAGCVGNGPATAQSPSSRPGEDSVLATIGTDTITVADLRERAGSELDQIEAQYLRARSQAIETALHAMLREQVLEAEARRQGKSVMDLILAEAGAAGLEPSEVEIATWYQENQARVGGRPLEQIRPQVALFLRNERRKAAEERLEQRLYRDRQVVVLFEPYRLAFNNEGAPSLGNPNAPVTLVEFSDFQCPFCARFAPTLKEIASTFGDQVHIVYRQLPIPSIHDNALKAAEASLCAHDQNKFWQMHDLMFDEPDRLTIPELKEKARRVGLNQETFDSCLDSGKHAGTVQKDMEEGRRAGVTGTPALFINGEHLAGGAAPFDVVAAAIRRELARVGR